MISDSGIIFLALGEAGEKGMANLQCIEGAAESQFATMASWHDFVLYFLLIIYRILTEFWLSVKHWADI